MKVILLALLVAATTVSASVRPYGYQAPSGGGHPSGPVVPIVRDDRDGPYADGTYNFNFETGDGITRQEQGAPVPPAGAVASQGSWSFTFPDGTPAQFSFVADGDGYKVESPLLPTPPPLPAHAIAQIEKARREDAAGGSQRSYSSAPSAPSTAFRPAPAPIARPVFRPATPSRSYGVAGK